MHPQGPSGGVPAESARRPRRLLPLGACLSVRLRSERRRCEPSTRPTLACTPRACVRDIRERERVCSMQLITKRDDDSSRVSRAMHSRAAPRGLFCRPRRDREVRAVHAASVRHGLLASALDRSDAALETHREDAPARHGLSRLRPRRRARDGLGVCCLSARASRFGFGPREDDASPLRDPHSRALLARQWNSRAVHSSQSNSHTRMARSSRDERLPRDRVARRALREPHRVGSSGALATTERFAPFTPHP